MWLTRKSGYWFKWHGLAETTGHAEKGLEYAVNVQMLQLELLQRDIILKAATPLPTKAGNTTLLWQRWFASLYSLTNSGFDLAIAVDALKDQSQCAQEAELSKSCSLALKQGQQLTEGLSQSQIVLEPSIFQWLRCAEQAGVLNESLESIAQFLSLRIQRLKALKQGLRYPLGVLSIALLLFLGLQHFVLPRFAALYLDSGTALPLLTTFILEPSQLLSHDSLLAALITFSTLIALGFIWGPWLTQQLGFAHLLGKWRWWQTWVFRPKLMQELDAIARGLNHGMTLHQSLQTVALYSPHGYHRFLWRECLTALEQGTDVVTVFSTLPFSSIERMRIELGERTGQLELQLRIVVKEQQAADQQRLAHLFSVIPQAMLIIVSIITGVVMIGLYLPLFQLGLAVS